jgi:uncharacterized protein
MNWITGTFVLALAGGLLASALPVTAQQIIDEEERVVPTLTVSGQAELEKPADELHLSLSVVTQGKEAQEAVQENSRTMKRVIEAIERVGLTKEEYETTRFSINPQYRQRPRNADSEWRPEIIGYTVENTLRIETTKLELVGELIEKGTDAGANNVGQLSFGLSDERAHRAEAITEAVQNARSDADALATAAGAKLVRILSINLDGAAAPPMPMRGERMTAMAMEMALPIQPGDVTVRASVTIVYEIAE